MPRTKVNDVSIHYTTYGKGPALVFLHGWTENHRIWKQQAEEFSKDYRIITIDHRGHGESDKPRAEYSMQILADDLCHVLDELGLSKAALVGHSMGGMVALVYCLRYPERVRGLVLVNTTSNGTGKTASFKDVLDAVRTSEWESLVEQFLIPVFFAPGASRDLINQVKSEILKTPQYVVEKAAKAMAEYDVTDQLQKINAPTLIIHGDHERAIDVKMAQILDGKIPNSTLRIIKGVGHHSFLEKPKDFNKIVREFLRKMSY